MYIFISSDENINMNHYILITIISILSLTSVISNSIKLISYKPRAIIQEITTEELTRYTIKEYNGRIALYKDDNPKPINVYDIFVSSLPETDITTIRSGITVYSEIEAQHIIDEYTS